MADVVLHYGPGSAVGLGLLERTEKLLESFPCRTPPVFSPWFTDRHPPIRPARPAPVIVWPAGSRVYRPREPEVPPLAADRCRDTPPPGNPPKPEDETGHKDGVPPATDSPLKRSWSVFFQRGGLQAEALSKPFRHAVSVHRLHLHQRAKWVWRDLSRCSRSADLPTCNATIRRDRAEVWVFCDVGRSEQVGRFLNKELQLSGGIELSVHGRGNIFSL
ncbi:hypothetical protein EYF80_037579 [Liparis tanakae]|uniref:Uncharacterized protein n=1 Tax=Liparis tanakae TaxID=230148 RepID=A0A4Z2GH63_9TELE|nr:hypothetical protein EYF80_037579 [Liparis tanakae]